MKPTNPAFVAIPFFLGLLFMAQSGFRSRPAASPSARPVRDAVFSPAYIKAILLRTAQWQLQHPKHAPTDWTNGAFYAGVFAAYQTTKSPVLLDSLLAMGTRNQWCPGARFDHADDIAICQTYIDLYRIKKDRRMIQPTIDTIQKMQTMPGREVAAHGLTWWWCDALFMGPPVLARLSATLNKSAYNRLSDSLFRQTYTHLYSQQEHLFARDANYLIDAAGAGRREANGQKIFWSRGNGWVMGGIVRVLQELPADNPSRPFYLTLFRQMSERLLGLQQADGLWRTSLLDPAAYPGGEASGSGFDCYALAWGVNHGILATKTYRPAVEKAWVALTKLVSPEGRVGWVQPIGGDPRRNFSEDSWEVYGTGAFLLAGSEVIRLKP